MNRQNAVRYLTIGAAIILLVGFWRIFAPNTTVMKAWLGSRQAMYESGKYFSELPDAFHNHKPIPSSYSPVWARYWYFRAANNGHPGAMFEISEEYGYIKVSYYGFRPRWLPNDPEKCQFWLAKAAENDSIEAMKTYVQMYQGSQQDIALKWAQRGADLGDPFCMGELAKAYRFAYWGLARDDGKYRFWMDKAMAIDREREKAWRR